MSELRCGYQEHPGAVVLEPAGWIDISCVGGLQRLLDAALVREDIAAVALDFTEAEYIDSATVSVLIRAKSMADERKKQFALVSLATQIHRVLVETHLIDVFEVFENRVQFLDQLAEAPLDESS